MRALTILLAVLLGACVELGDDELYEAAFDGGGGAGEANFEAVNAIFQSSCALSGCHSSDTPGQISLDEGEAYASLLGPDGAGGVRTVHPDCAGASMVEPGDPEESCLWIRVGDGTMPPGGMPQPLRETIRAWIAAGAPPP